MKSLKFVLPAMLAVAGLTVGTSVTFAKPEYSKKEKKPCTLCHTDIKKPKELTAIGKHYGEKKTLEGAPKK